MSQPQSAGATKGRGRTRGMNMIKVSALYPNTDGSTFDMEYYCRRHIAMVRQKFGAACKGVSVEKGMSGGTPDSPPAYLAMGHLLFDSIEAFQAAFAPHAQAIMDDAPNYTNVQPIIQISEVRMHE